MTSWPYIHTASAAVTPEGQISVAGPEPAAVTTAGFHLGAAGDMGSPETLMVCAVAWSFAAAFRTEAAAAGIPWNELEIAVDGTVDRNRHGPHFSRFDVHLKVDSRMDDQAALEQAGQRALAGCMVTNSLAGSTHVGIRVQSRAEIPHTASSSCVFGDGVPSHA